MMFPFTLVPVKFRPLAYLVVVALFLLLIIWGVRTIYGLGQADIQAKWDSEKASQATQRARVVTILEVDVVRKTDIVYRDRVQTIVKEGKTIYEEVPVYIPVDSSMPWEFVMFYDLSLDGDRPTPELASIFRGTTTSTQEAARRVTDNNTSCRIAYERVAAYEKYYGDLQEKLRLLREGKLDASSIE